MVDKFVNSNCSCGLSYVGRIEPANPIYLSFMCGNPMGVAIHETLHALGLQHEQLRIGGLPSHREKSFKKIFLISDRDKFITVNWENVNPQQYDFFAVSDMTKFSSYGMYIDCHQKSITFPSLL
jgi:astacin